MIKPEILKETPVSMIELKSILKKAQKADGELNFRAGRAMEYVDQFTKLSKKKYDELFKKIDALKIARLKDVHIIKLIDILPKTTEEIKSAMQNFSVSIPVAEMKRLADVFKDYY